MPPPEWVSATLPPPLPLAMMPVIAVGPEPAIARVLMPAPAEPVILPPKPNPARELFVKVKVCAVPSLPSTSPALKVWLFRTVLLTVIEPPLSMVSVWLPAAPVPIL